MSTLAKFQDVELGLPAVDPVVANRLWSSSGVIEVSGSAPGNSKYYGTNGSGIKGYFDLPSSGDVVGPSSSIDSEIALFNSTTGKLIKRATGSGLAVLTSGVLSTTTNNSSNWDTAFTERHQWDGGATNLVAATGRTSLGLGTASTLASDTDGTLATNSDSRIATQKATKTYIDAINAALIAQIAALDSKDEVAYCSTSALPTCTYANGSSGVGATLTATANGPLIIDSATIVVGAVGLGVLVAGQASDFQNGWYTITQQGVVAVSPWILTRRTSDDQAAEIGPGYLTAVEAPTGLTAGSANNQKVFLSIAPTPFVVGTSSLTFALVGGTYTAGNGLSLSGTAFSINTSITADLSTAQSLSNKTFVAPILGTPTSGTLTNCTFPTLNQNTTGSAGSLSVSGQTGLVTVTGLASTNRAKTVRDAADTILELGGSYTPTGTWTSLTMVTPALGAATGTSLVLSSFLNEAKGADIASATTTDIGAATGNYVVVTGTTTITGLGTVQAGTRRIVKFSGALTLTHNATSLILPGSANITTVAGDTAIFVSLGSGNWICVSYEQVTWTGSGSLVLATSPTFVTPVLGTPTSGTLTNCTFPTLNQNTTGSAASLSVSGQTGLLTVTGLASTNRAKTVRDAADTILELGGSYTPTGTWTSLNLTNPVVGTQAAGDNSTKAASTAYVDGGSTNHGGWTTKWVSGSNATTTGQALVDITGLVSDTLANSTLYEFEAVLSVLVSADSTGIKFGIHGAGTGTAATVFLVGYSCSANAITTGSVMTLNAVDQSSLTVYTSNNLTGVTVLHGFFTSTSTGTATLSIQHLKVTSGTSTIKIGSLLRYRLAGV